MTIKTRERHKNQAEIRQRLRQAHQADGLPEYSYYRAIHRLFEWGIYTADEVIKPVEIATICANDDTDTALARVCTALEALEINGVLTRINFGSTYNPRYRLAIDILTNR
ncbi:hypothetical protein KYT24_004370 [Salmonella enterica]|nr:hypothetical protein [Salmonella enterica]